MEDNMNKKTNEMPFGKEENNHTEEQYNTMEQGTDIQQSIQDDTNVPPSTPSDHENTSSIEPLEVITVESSEVSTVEDQPQEMLLQKEQHSEMENVEVISSQPNVEDKMFHAIPEAPKKNKKRNEYAWGKYRTAALLSGCLVLSGIGSFGGFYLAQSMNKGVNNVSYQSVIRTASANDNERVTGLSAKDVANIAMDSVVEIRTESVQNGSFMQQFISQGAGSGVILSENGHIVTNHHVINGASKITVRTKDGTEYDAKLLGSDATTDLAVLKIEATGLKAAVLGDSEKLSVGDKAYAIGNPLGELGGTVTDGIISALDRELTVDNQPMRLLQTSAAINPGNSGGGLFNDAGELIGIVNAKSSGSDIEGLGFAIPINSAKTIIDSLLNSGYVQNRAQLGVSLINISDRSSAAKYGLSTPGVYIAEVVPSSGAHNAGLQSMDRIISINEKEVTTSADIKKVIDESKAGDVVKLQIARNEKIMEVDVTLTESVPQ